MNTLLLIIIGLPILEITLMIKIGQQIGTFNTVLIIFFTAIVGIYYAKVEGLNTIKAGMVNLYKNKIPFYEILSGATIAIAAILLILPGFISDTIGLLFLFPFTRKIIINLWLKNKYKNKIMNNDKNNRNVIGHIIIKGENVTNGYINNPKANAESFINGWFLTGDEGIFDDDGYLKITGRLKEIINRGGEKISPKEIDEILMDHESVQQAVAFSVPHEKLGEDLFAAVVLKENKVTNEASLKDYCKNRLTKFKIPRKILIINEIPKGPTGKLQRIGLAEKLGIE